MSINLIREIFYVSIAVFIILYIISIYLLEKNKKAINKLTEYKINVEATISDSIPTLLENIISECFNEYIILNVEYKNIQYIDADLETKIAKDVGQIVSERLSPAMLAKVSLYYNMNSISNIISEKIYMMVLEYSITKNSIKDDIK